MICRTIIMFACLALLNAQDFRKLDSDDYTLLRAQFQQDQHRMTIQNALADHSISELAVNRALQTSQQHLFSDIIDVKGITDQQSSGRCWLFAGLNILRPGVIEQFNLEDFEFSQNYLFFYDKMEKANLFLNYVIQWRDRSLEDRELNFLLENPINDGGQWNMVVDLVDKYGVVPMSAMPETYASSNTKDMNKLLRRRLRRAAAQIREGYAAGIDANGLEEIRMAAMSDIYRVLSLSLGEPPREFVWRYENKKGRPSKPVKYTPVEFRDLVVRKPLSEYVYLLHDPSKELYQTYSVTFDRDMVEKPDMSVVNIPLKMLKRQTLEAVTDGEPIWFACDVGKDQLSSDGLMVRGIYSYNELLGVDFSLSKEQQIRYRESIPTHAMVFVGVDRDKGIINQWRVENSWGTDRGREGYWLMDDAWFDQNLYGVILPRDFLTSETLEAMEKPPVVVPPWDPCML